VNIRVGIVDDHPVFRLGLEAAISEMEGIDLVARAGHAGDVQQLLRDVVVDVLLLDVRLEDGSGLEVNRWVNQHLPEVRVVMLTMSEDHDTALTALRDGARGYLVKGAGPERVEHAIRTAMAGDIVLDQSLVTGVTELAEARRNPVSRPFPELTDREFDVLALVAEGMDNASIARTLVLSPKTVRNHVSNIFAKIGVVDRAGAIVLARRHGVGH
jgi:DNA-binding NarL/FixJ family response regulator